MTKNEIILYRGVRLRDYQIDEIKKHGMKYYWNKPYDAINDIFRALEKNHKIKQFGTKPMIRDLVLEATREYRLKVWCTVNKANAESYARHTPELIFLALDFALLERKALISYLNSYYGKPYVVTFKGEISETKGYDINSIYGDIVESERIMDIEPVDITKPDPYLNQLSSNLQVNSI